MANLCQKNLYVIDAKALAFRAYYASVGMTNPAGKWVGVVTKTYEFMQQFHAAVSPNLLVLANDFGGKTFRHEMYKDYKSGRKEKTDEFLDQINDFFKFFEILGVPKYEQQGYEADDVIGSICKKYANDDLMITIVSPDKDFMQLVGDNVRLLRVNTWPQVDVYDTQRVLQKSGVLPSQYIEYLSIVGDSADSIPGIKGIGAKGAASLLSTYGSLKNIYNSLPLIRPNHAEKLRKSLDDARLSYKLARIYTDLDVDIDLAAAETSLESLHNIGLLHFLEQKQISV